MDLELAVLAAWLHDVGKVAQRAEAPASRGLEQEYCPQGETHRHVLYTDYFIEHTLPLPPELEPERSRLARTASAHHRPNTASREECALQRADCLSSGGDRVEGTAGGSYKSARLESIFTAVHLNGKGMPDGAEPLRYRLLPLDAENGTGDGVPIFPCRKAGEPSYKALYAGLCEALKHIPLDMGVRHYMHSLAAVLERFTWCVPSSTYCTRADISLYDHAATTAAVTQALLACPEGEERFVLFGGDLSGIQKFIFGAEDQAGKGASKLLRARSFLLQALTRSVRLILLERLGLSSAATVMDAGGRFVLLLPDTDRTHRTLDDLEREAERRLLDDFQGTVRMTFARLTLEPDELRRERFAERFEEFNDRLEAAKMRPFAALFAEHLSPVLPVDHDGYRHFGECALCRTRPADKPVADPADVPACSLCRRLLEAGRRLPRTRFLVFSRRPGGLPLFGGLFLHLEETAPHGRGAGEALDIVSIRDRTAFSAAPVAGYIPVLSQEDSERFRQEGRPLPEGEEVEVGAPKTFAVLAEASRIPCAGERKRWRSVPCLAVCKADVDNLGLLFGMGFGTGKESLFSVSRLAMLSRMMNHFFAGHLMRVIEREFPDIYVIFAGGDDLFVLGPWAEAVRFALRLEEDFRAFTGGNPAVTLSAGLPVVKPRLPVRAVREAAEQALEQAKSEPEKNAACLFGVAAPWPLFRTLVERGQHLERLCLEGATTQGLMRRLLGYARDCRDFAAGDIPKGLYLSHMAYDLARNCNNKMSAEDMQRLQSLGQDKIVFSRAELSLSWALYRTRISG